MTAGRHSVASLFRGEPPATRDYRESRRRHPLAALAEMIDKALTTPPAASADVLNEVHRLGETAAAALLDAGDLCAWELTTRVACEISALARTGWLPVERR